ncbi:hypothetical protein JCM6882_001159 [Rhodosporidiobolus microsporus]
MSRPPLNLVFPDRTTAGISKNADGERVVAASRRADGSVRKELKIRPGFTPQEDVALYRSRGAVEAERRQATRGVVPGLRPGVGAAAQVQAALGATGGAAKKRSRGKKGGAKGEEKKRVEEEEDVPDAWDAEESSPSTATPATAEPAAAASTSSSSSSAALPPPVPSASSTSAPPPPPTTAVAAAVGADAPLDPAEREKRARALRKKLRQAEQLRDRSSPSAASSSAASSPATAPVSTLTPAEREKVDSIARLLAELEGLTLKA